MHLFFFPEKTRRNSLVLYIWNLVLSLVLPINLTLSSLAFMNLFHSQTLVTRLVFAISIHPSSILRHIHNMMNFNAAIEKLLFFLGWLIEWLRIRKKKIVYGFILVISCAVALDRSYDYICDSYHDSMMSLSLLLYYKLWTWKEYEGGFPAFAVLIRRQPQKCYATCSLASVDLHLQASQSWVRLLLL